MRDDSIPKGQWDLMEEVLKDIPGICPKPALKTEPNSLSSVPLTKSGNA